MRSADDAFHPSGSSPVTSETIDDALAVLGDLLVWKFSSERWERVESIVVRMREAVDAHDEAALVEATVDLELAGPTRITRIGDTPLVPPPRRVRTRANELIHSLGGDTAHPPDSPEPDGADAGDTGDQPSDR
ncbi:CATRA system-associated protein [Actinomadura sp. 9N215]|uniref:CATRA system-associated protein n=1 Tax=Actinomadura sp. 9N215 TaxID=3375150 RepID=UPI0037925626